MSRLPPPFGPFHPVRRLGAGGMAETFVAIRRGPGDSEQHVCIKRILPAFEDDREFVEGFLHEAKTSAALRHGNIVQVLDFGVADGAHYLALELVEGLDLRALLGDGAAGHGRLDAELTALIAGDLCAALEHAHASTAHRAPVVHRDVSPSNVLISSSGEVKLTDFGIARAIGGRHRTASGVIKGKVPYMPPEYIEHGLFDQRGDLFALGVMLYELLTGTRPYDGESDLDTIRRIVTGVHKPLADLAPATPSELVSCVERLLRSDPAARFGSAREFLDALPHVSSHKVRKRLAELVHQRQRERGIPVVGGDTVATPSRPRASTAPALHDSSASSTPTRTSRQGAKAAARGPSARALLALLLAATCLVAVLIAAYLKLSGPVSSAPPRGVPALPSPPPVTVAEAPPSATPQAEPVPPAASEAVPTLDPAEAPSLAAPATTTVGKPNGARESAELKIYVHPFGDIWVDGKRVGQSPVTLRLPPGSHDVGVGDGRPRLHRTVRLSAGQREKLEIERSDVAEP